MKRAVLLSILASVSSFYVALPTPISQPLASNLRDAPTIDMVSVLEQIAQVSSEHHLTFISFSPLFERGQHYYCLRLEAKFANFIAWYADIFHKIPQLKWQHLRLKPKKQGILVILEGRYGD